MWINRGDKDSFILCKKMLRYHQISIMTFNSWLKSASFAVCILSRPENSKSVKFKSGPLISIWVRSRNCGCLVTWFCYQLIAKPGNKTVAVSWPDPYIFFRRGRTQMAWYHMGVSHVCIMETFHCDLIAALVQYSYSSYPFLFKWSFFSLFPRTPFWTGEFFLVIVVPWIHWSRHAWLDVDWVWWD